MVHPRMRTSGALDTYSYIDATNALGREYPDVQLSDIIADDSKIKDLAITGEQTKSAIGYVKRTGANKEISLRARCDCPASPGH